jgi:hypothetical protein
VAHVEPLNGLANQATLIKREEFDVRPTFYACIGVERIQRSGVSLGTRSRHDNLVSQRCYKVLIATFP